MRSRSAAALASIELGAGGDGGTPADTRTGCHKQRTPMSNIGAYRQRGLPLGK
jgi:hypothetical protein